MATTTPWMDYQRVDGHLQEIAFDYDDSTPCVSAIPALLCQTSVRLHHGDLKKLALHCIEQTATFSSRAENVAVGCRMSFGAARLWFALLPNLSLTSTEAVTVWNQLSLLPSSSASSSRRPGRRRPQRHFPTCGSQWSRGVAAWKHHPQQHLQRRQQRC